MGRETTFERGEQGGSVRGKVRCELNGLGLVGLELDERYGFAERSWVSVRSKNTAPVDNLRMPRALFGVYAHTSGCLDSGRRHRCRCRNGGGGNTAL
jgi:hypothetical protein